MRPLPLLFLVSTTVLAFAGTASAQKSSAGEIRFAKASFNTFEDAGAVRIEIRRHRGSTGEASVEYQTEDGSATAGSDYEPVAGELVWGDGDGSSKTFEIPIVDDDQRENLEDLTVVLFNAQGAELGRPRASVKILPSDLGGDGGSDDEDEAPAGGWIAFDQRTYQSSERAGVAVVTVARRGGTTGDVSVEITSKSMTATENEDYLPVETSLEWPDGDASIRSFTVEIVDDEERERTESFAVLLSEPVGAEIHPTRGAAAVLVHDNDQLNDDPNSAGVFRFTRRDFQAREGQEAAEIVVERLFGKQQPVSVDVVVTDDTAVAGEDYEAVSETLTWARGDGRLKRLAVPILDDEEDEGNEVAQLRLENPGGGARIAPEGGEATLTILDDDGAATACTPSPSTACLQNGRFQTEVTWRLEDGGTGPGVVRPVSDSSVLYWFFDEDNVEMLVKILDGCVLLDTYWVFFAATTDVDFTLRVTDTLTGLVKEYTNPLGQAADAVTDTETFACTP